MTTSLDVSSLFPWIATTVLLFWGSYKVVSKRKRDNATGNDNHHHHNTTRLIPWASGHIPLLGHALEYQRDPSGFLCRAAQKSKDGIFQLNLAGKHMIVVCDDHDANNDNDIQKQLATMPESILSARQAVADIGFEQTLGTLNVYQGTSLHKGIVKGHLTLSNNSSTSRDAMVGQWTRAIQQAMKQETSNHDQPCEFFHWMRRVMLRTSIDVMIGKAFLQLEETEQSAAPDDVDFVDAFMKFQDTLEDVTAKAVVLPRPIALHFFLIPLEKRRKKLQRIIEKRLEQILQPKPADGNYSESISSIGFWLQEVLVDDKQYSLLDMAEFIVGLLFAAHKNPAIGAAQSYLLLRENNNGSSENLLETCTAEARRFLEHPSWDQVIPSNHEEYSMLQRVCYETLRITAHSIGAVRTAKQEVMVEIKTMKNDKNSTTASTSSSYYYKIPKGASVSFSHIVPNLNESVWGENASKFNIQRQLTKSDTDHYRDEYKFTTFSHGVHKCPGQHLAMILLQASLSILLVEYTVEFASPKIPPLSFERATLAQRKGPVLVTIQNKNRR